VRRSQYAQNPEFGEAQEMTCTMRHWEQTGAAFAGAGSSPSGGGGASVDPRTLPPPAIDENNASLSSAERVHRSLGSGKRSDPVAAVTALLGNSNNGADPTRGRELLLCPVHLPQSSSTSSFGVLNSSAGGGGGSEKVGGKSRSAAAGVLSQRFHSFGSTPGVTHLPEYAEGGRQGFDAGSDPGIALSSMSSVPSRPPSRLRGGMGARVGVRIDRVMSDGNMGALDGSGRPLRPRRASTSNGRTRSAGKRAPSIPRIRPSAAAAFAVGGRSGVGAMSAEKAGAHHDGSSRHDLTALRSYQIPLSDVIVVDVDGISSDRRDDFASREGCRMNITTASGGYFEFVFQSKNAHDVLLAFLQASLPPERITNGAAGATAAGGRDSPSGVNSLTDSDRAIRINTSGCCDTNEGSYDMEGFTAREMTERVKREGLGSKIRRRFVHIVSQLQDVSLSLTECFCGTAGDSLSDDNGGGPVLAAAMVSPSTMPVAPQTPTPTYHHDRGVAAPKAHHLRSSRRHPPAVYTTPRKQGTIDHKFSMEHTPQAQQQHPAGTTTHATAEARMHHYHQHHPGHISFEASTPGQPSPRHYSVSDALGSAPPLIPDMVESKDNGSDGPITPVSTSGSEDEGKDEDVEGAKLHTVDI